MTCNMQPPWEFLLSASRTSLQSYELSRLNHASNLKKQCVQLLEAWLEENTNAMLARLLLDRPQPLAAAEQPEGAAETAPIPELRVIERRRQVRRASDNIFADAAAPADRIRHG